MQEEAEEQPFDNQLSSLFFKMLARSVQNITSTVCRPVILSRLSIQNYSDEPMKMEKSINQVNLLGRVGADPQQRGSDNHPVVTFSLATHNNYKYESGDWAQRTDWHRIVVFKPQLRDAVMGYLKKGQRTMVQGKITYGEITDKDGKARMSTSIIADDVIFFKENS